MMSHFEAWISAGLLAVIFSGSLPAQSAPAGVTSSSPAPGASDMQSAAGNPHNNSYVIGDDDVLEINVWKEKDLSFPAMPVRSDGKISMPLIGELQASGRTPLQLETEITSKLKSYITEPLVTVIVQKINSKKYNIMGQVARPGSYSLGVAGTVMDAIAAAGGFRDFAKKKDVYVLRGNADGTQARLKFNYDAFIKGKSSQRNIPLQPGDTVVVP